MSVELKVFCDVSTERKGPIFWKDNNGKFGEVPRIIDFAELVGNSAGRYNVVEIHRVEYLQLKEEFQSNHGQIDEDETQQNETSPAGVLVDESTKDGKLAADTAVVDEPTQEVKPGRSVFSLDELTAGPDDKRPSMNDREIEIVHALNDLLSGHTGIMSKEEAEGIVTCTGHLVSYVTPLLLRDIESAEFCLHPDFSDGEIHDVATTILDSWSDNDAFRQKLALDAIVEYRKPSNGFVQKADSVNHEMVQKGESVNQYAATSPFTYHQQLTIAAIQGLCANPAYAMCETPLSEIADTIANSVIYLQGADNENHL